MKNLASFSFSDGQLHLALSGGRIVHLHDTVTLRGVTYHLFHEKTQVLEKDGATLVRCSAVSATDGAPLPGLMVTYRFTYRKDWETIAITTDVGCDQSLVGCTFKHMELSYEGFDFNAFTGYEYTAAGPFEKTFPFKELNLVVLSKEEQGKLNYHQMLEKASVQPKAFRNAVALSGAKDYLGLIAGLPTWTPATGHISGHPEMARFNGDLRFFSQGNPLSAWLVLKKPADMFAAMEALKQAPPAPALPEHGEITPYTLQAGKLTVRLAQTRSGLFLAGVGENAQPGGLFPLFHLTIWDSMYERTIHLDSGSGWDGMDILQTEDYFRCLLRNPENGTFDGLTVSVEAFLTDGRIQWKSAFINTSSRYGLHQLSYPNLVLGGDMQALIPSNCGMVIPEVTGTDRCFHGNYPFGCNSAMGYFAFYNEKGGLYAGVHDPDGSFRRYDMISSTSAKQVLLSVTVPAENIHKPGCSFTLPGCLVWQVFDGDWYDATRIYRDFVMNHAHWLAPLRGRSDSPQWLRETPMWIFCFMTNDNPDANPVPITLRPAVDDPDPDSWCKLAIRLREALGVPISYHVYNWHWVPFNNDNPHYFPAKPNFRRGVRALHDADIRVIPYIAGYSWDMHDRRGEDYRYLTEAEPNTAKTEQGGVLSKSYAAVEPNGVKVAFARMCPATPFWKQEMRRVVRRLYDEYEVDGVYLDVISAQYERCCSPDHGHLPGYGHFWGDAYRELLQYLRVDAPRDFALTSESCAEVYSGALDAFLSWQWNHVDLVPAFPQIYGGYVTFFGRNISYQKRDDIPYFKFHTAQSLLYGQQIGWIHPEVVDDERRLPYLKKVVNLRWDLREFFAEAIMLRPPVVEGCTSFCHADPPIRENLMTHEMQVLAAGWQDKSGKSILFVANIADTPQECTLNLSADEYGAIPDAFVNDEGRLQVLSRENGFVKLSASLEPNGILTVSF